MPARPRLIIWAQFSQRELIADAAGAAGVELAGVASAVPDEAAKLAEALGVMRVDDVRRAVRAGAADALWLATPWSEDGGLRDAMRAEGVRVFMSELPPLLTLNPGTLIALSAFVPLARRSPGYRAAAAAIEALGSTGCLNLAFRCGPGQGSLFARLYDAMDIVNSLVGCPEMIDAACAGPLPSTPDSLPAMVGSITANLRFRENRCASVAVTDRAGSWFRGITALGDAGCVRLDDQGFEWLGADGRRIDAHREPAALTPGTLIGQHLRLALGGSADGVPPPDHPLLLSLCETVRLSCRTGGPEEPRRVREMISRV
jgi:hypothetical protein